MSRNYYDIEQFTFWSQRISCRDRCSQNVPYTHTLRYDMPDVRTYLATTNNIRPYIVPTILVWNCRTGIRCGTLFVTTRVLVSDHTKGKKNINFLLLLQTTTTERVHKILLVLPPTWSRWKFCHHG